VTWKLAWPCLFWRAMQAGKIMSIIFETFPVANQPRSKPGEPAASAGIGLRAFYGDLRPMLAMLFEMLFGIEEIQNGKKNQPTSLHS